MLVESSGTERQGTALIRGAAPVSDPSLTVRQAGLEEIVLAYMNQPLTGTAPSLALVATAAAPEESSR